MVRLTMGRDTEDGESRCQRNDTRLLFQCKIPEILALKRELFLSCSLESGWPLPSPHPALQHSSTLTHLTRSSPWEHFPRSLEGGETEQPWGTREAAVCGKRTRPVCGRSNISQHCSRAPAFDGSDLAGLLPAPFKRRTHKREG